MIDSLFACILEGIPTIKLLICRLKNDVLFRSDCGFSFSDRVPSEASFSRLIRKVKSSYVLDEMNHSLVLQAIEEGFITGNHVAIPLLKGIVERFPILNITKVMADAGYDYKPIYEQVYRLKADSIIAYNKRNEATPIGVDKYFAPTCVREHSYRYDSYDAKYETLKYTRPQECKDCPLADDTLCQKVIKIKKTMDLRRYSSLARGTKVWKKLYKECTS